MEQTKERVYEVRGLTLRFTTVESDDPKEPTKVVAIDIAKSIEVKEQP